MHTNILYRLITTMVSQTAAPGKHLKDQRFLYWRNHNKIVEHLSKGGGIDIKLMNEVLFMADTVSAEHIDMCSQIFENGITVDLPYPNTPKSIQFTQVAGSSNPSQSKLPKVPGCYLITHEDRSYIGQSVHLGKRVREHAGLSTPSNISQWIGSISQEAKVTLYRAPILDSYAGLNLSEFLCVLELYLFLVHSGTTENKSYVPTAGVMNTPDSIAKHLAKTAVGLYVYRKLEDGSLEYLYYSTSIRGFCAAFGVGKSYVSNVFSRTDGWYRGTLLFSKIDLLPGDTPSMSIEELKAYHTKLQNSIPRLDNPQIIATHKITGESIRFASRVAMRNTLKTDLRNYKIQVIRLRS